VSNRILVIGDSCKDVFKYGTCNRLSPEAPVPIFNLISSTENGGMAANVKNNIASLGCNVDICTNRGWESITKTRLIDLRTNHMFMRLDCNEDKYRKITKNTLKNIDYNSYDCVVISDYNKGVLSEENIKYISQQHPLVFLDTKKIIGDFCNDIFTIKINIHEYQASKQNINAELEDKIIVTLGHKGCRYRGVVYPVPKTEVKDVSGAGDTFLAALAVEYSRSASIEKAIIFANECATKVVQKRGVSII
jgi:D-beta-D-heptose 7-phosphate kinase/D-beta-D-heptose 1-phosphate adenosyltransferase